MAGKAKAHGKTFYTRDHDPDWTIPLCTSGYLPSYCTAVVIMEVSVIIPVYNAEKFINSAVQSACNQEEVKEILLIEDGSTDNSYSICQQLASDPRIKLITHPGHVNRGAAATRNLGIKNASMPFLAFLDSDDVYEPKRFENTKKIFEMHPDADGVHEMIGVHYYDPELKAQLIRQTSGENTGIKIDVPPSRLFRILASGRHGHISLDGLVLRRSSLKQDDLLDTQFPMSEDSEFILRLAANKKLYGGDVSRIVTLRGVHGQNSIFTNPRVMHFRKAYLEKCIANQFYGSDDFIAKLHIISRRVGAGKFYAPFRKFGKLALPVKLVGMFGYLISQPKAIMSLFR
jgi:glycosyltransferase involved in cell wall biosynthesis